MKNGRYFARSIVSVFVSVIVLLGLTPYAAARTTYDPDRIREALLNEPMLASEDLWGGVTGRSARDQERIRSPMVDSVTIASWYGAVGFNIYATDEEALSDSNLEVLDPIQDDEDSSITYYISWGTGDANTPAGAWVLAGNVMVLGLATPQEAYDAGLSGSVGGAAALASNHAKHGVHFLRRIGAGNDALVATATARPISPTPQQRATETPATVQPTETRASTTVVVPGDDSTAIPRSQASAVPPETVLPAGLQMQSGASYRLERAEAIELTAFDTTTPRAIGTYTAGEVAWFLDHPDFMDGGPYREIQALLSTPASPFFAHFNDPELVTSSLGQFGWQAGYMRQYSIDTQSANAAGWVEASAHRFATVEEAERANRILADQFAISSGFTSVSLSTTADTTVAYSGPGYNGNETAVFVQEANFVIVVIGVAPAGSPDATIQAVIESTVTALGT